MALITFHYPSDVLHKQTAATVILPDGGAGPFPVFYLLHGLSDDHTAWTRYTRIEKYVENLPLIVVMPDGYRSYYTDATDGAPFARHIGQELPSIIQHTFHADSRTGRQVIGGNSMGGYGSLRLGLGFAGQYTAVTSFSGRVMIGHDPTPTDAPLAPWEYRQIFGSNPRGTDHDVLALAKRAAAAGKLPAIRIDCGTEDHLLDMNRRLHAGLTALGVAHEYEEFPGGHEWGYWDLHVRDALRFHCRALGIAPTTAS